ncbi:glycine--tRNA ligase subunit beta [Xylanibacillus composti]|uniref:Glycine--tRNA ligase beta subunit n=1 Tax=Xylanibacillus composti TaxID=1572762 RepID=A0A8J4GZB3_9BACL|nr:glycine--tRNA ligase subunit beta [Xylanibacillus composti]MDT9724412.1 glycine--tRNA ligase subunit beta [Xylanibacillus composti]GIQ68008.1 glycine--tRNA ligase beta subunit [Xylanibacillus composti]
MSANHLLIEIGMEEVPARFIRGAADQFRHKFEGWLQEARIAYGTLSSYATPRRLALLVTDVAEKQEDLSEEVKGPSKKIALDDQGEWSKAALGFARGQGVSPAQLYMKDLDGVEYVFARKESAGATTAGLLPAAVTSIVTSMTFPKNMRWGAHELKYVRPIRWMTVLYGAEVVPLDIAGVQSGRLTRGHRTLGGEIELGSASEYADKLRGQFVMVDVEERKQAILDQLARMAQERGWNIPIQDDLLEEVLFLVEWPTALSGSFDASFLQIPQEVLITSMREHQRYFPVLDMEGKLLPHFVTVRNGDDASLEQVAKGNEKVLRARLSDAKFFYQEDQKLSIASALERLEKIVYHEELGTVGDKVRRIVAIAGRLAKKLEAEDKTAAVIQRAAEICKFDLVTQMVYEFPELQGVMGEDYARKAGESEEVAVAINEHYQPRFAGDDAPASLAGAIVGLADKLDTLVGCFSIHIIPTGSQDPYALRRNASGIVQILLKHELPLELTDLFDAAIAVYQSGELKRNEAELRKDLLDFFKLRVKHVLSERTRYDVADAVLESGLGLLHVTVGKADALQNFVGDAANKETLDSFVRVMNLAGKADSDRFDSAVFAEDVERELLQAWEQSRSKLDDALRAGECKQALAQLSELREPITRYFDSVMVMVEDEKLRNSRLGFLRAMANDLLRYADFTKVVW